MRIVTNIANRSAPSQDLITSGCHRGHYRGGSGYTAGLAASVNNSRLCVGSYGCAPVHTLALRNSKFWRENSLFLRSSEKPERGAQGSSCHGPYKSSERGKIGPNAEGCDPACAEGHLCGDCPSARCIFAPACHSRHRDRHLRQG